MAKIFISHSSENIALVDAFALLIEYGLALNRKDIFYSSEYGQPDMDGNSTKNIKDKLLECEYVIFLVTTEFMQSKFCMAEIGACWILEKPKYILLHHPETYHSLNNTPFAGETCRDIDKKEDLLKLKDTLTEHKICGEGNSPAYDKAVNKFLNETDHTQSKRDGKTGSSVSRDSQAGKTESPHYMNVSIHEPLVTDVLGGSYAIPAKSQNTNISKQITEVSENDTSGNKNKT